MPPESANKVNNLDKSLSQSDNLWVITNAISIWMAAGALN
jgi:hypothetical protein